MSASGGEAKGSGQRVRRRGARKRETPTEEGGNGSGTPDASVPIDWELLKANVLTTLRRSRSSHSTQNGNALVARGGHSLDDVVQDAIAEVHADKLGGGDVPQSFDELEALLVIKAKRRWKAWMKRAREQRANLQLIAPTLTIQNMFDVICARDECDKFFAALFDALDPEAQLLLETLLVEGIPFQKTDELAKKQPTSVAHVTNMKRRIIRHAERIMAELTSTTRSGGKS